MVSVPTGLVQSGRKGRFLEDFKLRGLTLRYATPIEAKNYGDLSGLGKNKNVCHVFLNPFFLLLQVSLINFSLSNARRF